MGRVYGMGDITLRRRGLLLYTCALRRSIVFLCLIYVLHTKLLTSEVSVNVLNCLCVFVCVCGCVCVSVCVYVYVYVGGSVYAVRKQVNTYRHPHIQSVRMGNFSYKYMQR